jgi:hypothetical protein
MAAKTLVVEPRVLRGRGGRVVGVGILIGVRRGGRGLRERHGLALDDVHLSADLT